MNERASERVAKLEGANEWLRLQFETAVARLQEAGVAYTFPPSPDGRPYPRSSSAQQRALDEAVARALERERARVARKAQQATPKLGS